MKNLVIVESPAKAKTIERFLGPDYTVLSSYGHIRDLSKQNLGIDVANDFQPDYVVSPDKAKTVASLKKAAAKADMVWLASDEDREGEAIAWHLAEVLELDPQKTRRIAFHEITKKAIEEAIKNPRSIDQNLVNAQQARRILDRLVGFEVSPILWRKIRPSLSAGRVQSVAVRLIADREREINSFEAESYYRLQAAFKASVDFKATYPKRVESQTEALELLQLAKGSTFTVANIQEKPLLRSPAPPFTTSTLQQEASRKLYFNASRTMRIAQNLYEAGHITYMRTDSVNLSGQAMHDLAEVIKGGYGEEYYKARKFTTKSKGAQEAHEAIRPTHAAVGKLNLSQDEQRLYDLIRKRALASQMANAQFKTTTVDIKASAIETPFEAKGEVMIFDGFLKVYMEGTDDEGAGDDQKQDKLPQLSVGQLLQLIQLTARQRFTASAARYSEAALVKKLEELGIGRPSTYAPTISTITERGYVIRESRDGVKRDVWQSILASGDITQETVQETTGAERQKLFPTDIGLAVTDYLMENFPKLMSYDFTANVEEQFDRIATGDLHWVKMLHAFYGPFHERVDTALESTTYAQNARVLGTDPATGKPVIARIGRYGPLAQIGEQSDEEKPRFASLRRDQLIETITLEEALKLFELPRDLGMYEEKEVVVAIGRFGPYVRHDGKFTSLAKTDDPYTIELPRAIELIEAKRKRDKERILRTFPEDAELQILKGRWGAYCVYKKSNYRLPKGFDYEKATYEEIMKIVESQPDSKAKSPAKKAASGAATKKAAPKKTSASKTATTRKAAPKKKSDE